MGIDTVRFRVGVEICRCGDFRDRTKAMARMKTASSQNERRRWWTLHLKLDVDQIAGQGQAEERH